MDTSASTSDPHLGYERLTLRDFVFIVYLHTKVISLSSFLVGTVYAGQATGRFSLPIFLLMLVTVLLADMAGTAFNSYYDFRSGVDRATYDLAREKVLVQRNIRPGTALRIAVILCLLATAAGLATAFMTDWRLIPLGVACLAIAYLYSGGPYPLSRTAWGELLAGLLYGPVLVGTSFYVQAGTIGPDAILVSLPSGTLVASILLVNNTCDRRGDAAAGRRTLAIRIGGRKAANLVYILGGVTFALAMALIPLGVLSWPAVLPLATVALPSVWVYRGMHRRGYDHATKLASMGAIALVFMAYSIAILAAILFAAPRIGAG